MTTETELIQASPETLYPGRTGRPQSTLNHLGQMLPIGVPNGTPPVLEKAFALRPFRMKEEREIDKIRSRKGGSGSHPGKVVADVLAYMLTEWGGDPAFSQKSSKVRMNAIRNAFMADVMYAYVWLRTEALGSVLGVVAQCPMCDHEWPWRTDLGELEVEVIDRYENLSTEDFVLANPIKFGEKVYDVFVIAPPTWAAVCDIQPNARRGGVGDIKARMIQSCVREVKSSDHPNDPPLSLGSSLLDQMSKRDIEHMTQFINDVFPSVDLSMQIECPNCTHEHLHQVQWNWDFFLSSSSLPSPSRG